MKKTRILTNFDNDSVIQRYIHVSVVYIFVSSFLQLLHIPFLLDFTLFLDKSNKSQECAFAIIEEIYRL